MSGTIRAFLAVEMPEAVTVALGELVGALSAANLRRVRLVRPEGIHLTLRFLGDIDEGQVGPITDAVSRIVETRSPSAVELGNVGAFPNPERPRVLWVGLAGETGPLRRLYGDIAECLVPLGFEKETRPFYPHLTLGRIRDGTTLLDRRKASAALCGAPFSRGLTIPVDSVSLMRSILRPAGAEHERLASLKLGQPPGRGDDDQALWCPKTGWYTLPACCSEG